LRNFTRAETLEDQRDLDRWPATGGLPREKTVPRSKPVYIYVCVYVYVYNPVCIYVYVYVYVYIYVYIHIFWWPAVGGPEREDVAVE